MMFCCRSDIEHGMPLLIADSYVTVAACCAITCYAFSFVVSLFCWWLMVDSDGFVVADLIILGERQAEINRLIEQTNIRSAVW